MRNNYRIIKVELTCRKDRGMGRIIAITNQKGGVGKTTTAINLSACLAEAGQRVLTVDFDPQGNTTSGLGLEKGNIDNTVYELLMGECTVDECINPSVQERLDVNRRMWTLPEQRLSFLIWKKRRVFSRKIWNC